MHPPRGSWSRLGALLALLAGCGEPAPPPAQGAGPAALPEVPAKLEELDPALRGALEAELQRVRASPDSGEAWRDLGDLYQANGFYTEAEVAYAGAVARAPGDALAWYGRALAALRDGRPAEAEAAAKQSLALDPSYAPGYWRLGEWCLAAGRLDEAVGWYERALEANPAQPGGWIGLARVHLQREEFQQAAEILAERILQGPCDGYGRHLLASALQGLGRVEEARQLAVEGKGKAPAIPDPRWAKILARETGRRAETERANALVKSGRPLEAIPIFERLIAAAPGDAALVSNLAFALLQAQRGDEALERARAAAALDPAAYRPVLIQGLVTMQRGPAALPEAVQLLRRAVELQPSAVDAQSSLGQCYWMLDDARNALEAFRRASAQAPSSLELLQNVGVLERRLGEHDAAERTYRAYLDLAPGHAGATAALAETFSARGGFAQAEALLRGALERSVQSAGPAHPDVRALRERLIAALEAQGKGAEAAREREAL
jgi:tetratricopeptide (TPR) repeat protein